MYAIFDIQSGTSKNRKIALLTKAIRIKQPGFAPKTRARLSVHLGITAVYTANTCVHFGFLRVDLFMGLVLRLFFLSGFS